MPIMPIVIGIITLIGGGAAVFYAIKTAPSKGNKKGELLSPEQKTAQDFVNVKDIKDKFLYTKDGYIIMYIKIKPLAIDLLSDREIKQLCKTITAQMSSERKAWKFLAVSRPVDIAPLINDHQRDMISTSDPIRKKLLRSEMLVMSHYALSGEVVERQFYFMLWEKFDGENERELAKRTTEFVTKVSSGDTKCEILNEQDIYRLCNLVNNPAYTNVDDATFESSFPIMA